ncbi:MAG: hypothetical protein SCARUB_00837 [Candidatus Scalindua rubra]|uniref:HicB-like antitoxin of toxin-antitoxin system domain-containing protein n=1 Tax=Candidatus Scalindua rubra TaxID=1872076 RepID=A0A1E3XGM1_9BACT|nr:MAG: hypothetical protein SCARUB_00837 [Candidatus Scalindua rubra]
MLHNFTARYTKIDAGYIGQLVEWPEVITEGKNIEECREMLRDVLNEMILAYQQQEKEIPQGKSGDTEIGGHSEIEIGGNRGTQIGGHYTYLIDS